MGSEAARAWHSARDHCLNTKSESQFAIAIMPAMSILHVANSRLADVGSYVMLCCAEAVVKNLDAELGPMDREG